jgi:hypothetical protein
VAALRKGEQEMTGTRDLDQDPYSRIELLRLVREIVATNPDRHRQEIWLGNAFGHVCGTAGEARQYALSPLPEEPGDPQLPVCGTRGCVAGWLAILSLPAGTRLEGDEDGFLRLPDGSFWYVRDMAMDAAGLDFAQADWLFNGGRTREQVIAGLDMLIQDENADLWSISAHD